MTNTHKADAFRKLHQPGNPFVIANGWDAGSARMLAGLGFKAIATTSSGFAMAKGRKDYCITRAETIARCCEIMDAIDVPVSADLENGWADTPAGVADTIALAAQTGLAGGSIEDASGDPANPIYDAELAVERIAAAGEAARAQKNDFVLTARCETFLWADEPRLDDVISRLQRFEAAGADVLFAPGLPDMESLRILCSAVSKPVNALVYGGLMDHKMNDFAEAGAARISIGGGLANAAYGTLASATAMLSDGDFGCLRGNNEDLAVVSKYLQDS